MMRDDLATHLNPTAMEAAQRGVTAKALREFAHERLVTPRRVAGETGEEYEVAAGDSRYRFVASEHPLEHLAVDEASLRRLGPDDTTRPLDAQALVLELRDQLGLTDALIDLYLEELASTLQAAAWVAHRRGPSARELVDADFQTIESAMTGHPSFVATNGRIGFGLADHRAFAPETGEPVRLFWVAVRREDSHLSLSSALEEEAFYRAELGDDVDHFRSRLRRLDLDPADYRWLPLHPWQWQHKVSITHAPAVGRHDIVPLGHGSDRHQAQQSIRTMINLDSPHRSYVKMALSVQNMGFLRGLSPRYMRATPAINDWVHALVEGDPDLRAERFTILREHAAIGWTGGVHTALSEGSAFAKMVAALWRESPVPRLGEGERLATMASLLHRDAEGVSLAAEWIAASGLEAREWVARYLRAYLRPVLHCLLAHDLSFMPHGENLILVLDGHVVSRVILKDIGEECAVLSERELPEEVARIRQVVDDAEREMTLFTDVFDGFLRHLGATLATDGVLDDAAFWGEAARVIADHRADHPALHERFDFFRPTFRHTCLNRLQLRNTLQMVDITDQANSLLHAGMIANPVAEYVPAHG